MSRFFTFIAALATLSVIELAAAGANGQADKPLATKQNKVTATVTVKAIDPATRSAQPASSRWSSRSANLARRLRQLTLPLPADG
jgi:hypothetical protein